MTIEEIKQELVRAGFTISEEKRLGNDTGSQIRLTSGQIVNVFDKGTWNVQGKNPEEVRAVLSEQAVTASPVRSATVPDKVFVVYGH